MRRNIHTALAVLATCILVFSTALPASSQSKQAKYVFYFIGDGMGTNQVNGTEMYIGETQGKIGTVPLCFANFPYCGFATTFSATNSVTDSAAGGTALATGEKTYNAAIGVNVDSTAVLSIAEKAQKAGRKVGIATSVSIDHATPAAFYAHKANRNMYYEIATDIPNAGFHFYAGAGFLEPQKGKRRKAENIFDVLEENGYTIAKGHNEFNRKCQTANKIILTQKDGKDAKSLPYAIDREDDDLTLAQITQSAIRFLTKGEDTGFFLMVEGGKIDWACHDNDAATMVNEVIDFDNAIKVAYEFYQKHPKETLIVITADHETGGFALGTGNYALNLKALASQTSSQEQLSVEIGKLRIEKDNRVEWKDIRALLEEHLGFWDTIALNEEQEESLKEEYAKSFGGKRAKLKKNEYSLNEPLAIKARKILNDIALVGWTSGGHSAGYVPVFAIGAGAELFHGRMDNTEIPEKISHAAGY